MSSLPVQVIFSICPTKSNSEYEDREAIFSYVDGQAQATIPNPWKRGRPKGSKNKAKLIRRSRKPLRQIPPEFVNLSVQDREIGKDSRTLIRKYAKLGQVSQQDSSTLQPQNGKRKVAVGVTVEKGSRDLPTTNLLQITDVDPFDTSPITLEPYMHDLLIQFGTTIWKNIYSLEEFAGCNPIAEYWLPIAFKDPALLHSFIGCADAYVSGYSTTATRGLKHLQAAISIVNRRIGEQTYVKSLGTLAVVAGIALLEKGAGNHGHWRVHMQGLRRLVDLHGGIECLYSEPLLLNKIYSADLCGSFNAREPPYFMRQSPLHFKTLSGTAFRSDGFNIVHKQIGLNESLRDCVHQLEDTLSFWQEIDNNPICAAQASKGSTAKVARIRYVLINVQYALASTIYQQEFESFNCNI